MMTAQVISLLVLTFLSTAKSNHVVGSFGGQQIPIDFYFGNKIMTVTTRRPVNAPDTFRDTTNLHIFSTHLVAIRNSADKECYVQPFNATLAGMREKVETAITNHGDYGEVKEERIFVDRSQLLPSWSVSLLGPEITNFCSLHDMYLIGDQNSQLLKENAIYPKRRGRRSVLPNQKRARGRRVIANPDGWRCRYPQWKDVTIMC